MLISDVDVPGLEGAGRYCKVLTETIQVMDQGSVLRRRKMAVHMLRLVRGKPAAVMMMMLEQMPSLNWYSMCMTLNNQSREYALQGTV